MTNLIKIHYVISGTQIHIIAKTVRYVHFVQKRRLKEMKTFVADCTASASNL
jgi:hypothetical protein